MNTEIRRVAFVALVLVGALIVGTTYWQAWAAGDLAARQDNAIKRVAEFKIKRGLIYAADGTVLASNRRLRTNGQTFYLRGYPQGSLLSNVVGYSTQGRSRAGLERAMNDYLTGSNSNLHTVLETTLNGITGRTIKGNSLVLTIDPAVQRTAVRALGSNCGAAVALEPSTGRVLAMATSPRYDANKVERDFGSIVGTRAACRPAAPLVNRATAGLYVPGSTFKLVTAAAALDTGAVTPQTVFDDRGLLHRVRQARLQLRRPVRPRAIRPRHVRRGAAALDQCHLLRRRQAARRDQDPRLRRALRHVLRARPRDARLTSSGRAGSTGAASSSSPSTTTRSTPAGSPSARSGWA